MGCGIVTWVPGHSAAIPGELAFEGNEAPLTLKRNQPGCGTVGDDMTGDGLRNPGPLTMSTGSVSGWSRSRVPSCAPGPVLRAIVRLTSSDTIPW
jgi:hypothetical protein